MTSIRPIRMNHLNVVLEDFEGSVAHFANLFGGDFLLDLPSKEWHACLMETGRVIYEFFVPHKFLLNTRYGPHYLGIEYQADMTTVRQAIGERRMRIVRDLGVAVYTHPHDAHGISFEFYGDEFHNWKWPAKGGAMMKTEAEWAAHPYGPKDGLLAYTVCVENINVAGPFFQNLLSGEPLYDEARPTMGAHALGLKTADTVLELLQPTGPGLVRDHLTRWGEGIRSTVHGVADLGKARAHFAGKGVPLEAGSAPGRVQIPAAANMGILMEFAE